MSWFQALQMRQSFHGFLPSFNRSDGALSPAPGFAGLRAWLATAMTLRNWNCQCSPQSDDPRGGAKLQNSAMCYNSYLTEKSRSGTAPINRNFTTPGCFTQGPRPPQGMLPNLSGHPKNLLLRRSCGLLSAVNLRCSVDLNPIFCITESPVITSRGT